MKLDIETIDDVITNLFTNDKDIKVAIKKAIINALNEDAFKAAIINLISEQIIEYVDISDILNDKIGDVIKTIDFAGIIKSIFNNIK